MAFPTYSTGRFSVVRVQAGVVVGRWRVLQLLAIVDIGHRGVLLVERRRRRRRRRRRTPQASTISATTITTRPSIHHGLHHVTGRAGGSRTFQNDRKEP